MRSWIGRLLNAGDNRGQGGGASMSAEPLATLPDKAAPETVLSAVLDALPVGVIIADAHGKILRNNPASRELWGAPPAAENWEGYSNWIGYWPDSGQRLKAEEWPLARTLRTGEAVRNELIQSEHAETGERRFFLSNAAPIFNAKGQIIAAVAAETDVTERRQVAEALRQSEERLRLLNADLERQVEERTAQAKQALEKLFEARRMESVGQFASTVVHDFANVLTVIMANLRVLQRLLTGEAHANLVDKAISTAERAAALAGRLLLYARRDDTSPEAIFVGELLGDMRPLLEFSLGECINCVINAPAHTPPIFVERHRLELALMNLATNARDAMPNGGTFFVSVSEETVAPDQDAPALKAGDYVRIFISDSGCGMNEATLERAAEPLFTTKKATRGTGLGLSMVKEFVEQSGGAWRLTSVEGRGTTVDIWLPQMAAT